MKPLSPTQSIIIMGSTAKATIHTRTYLLQELCKKAKVTIMVSEITEEARLYAQQLGCILVESPLSRISKNPFAIIRACRFMYHYLRQHHFTHAYLIYSKTIIFGGLCCYSANIKHRIAILEGLGFAYTKRPKTPISIFLLSKIIHVGYRFILPKLTGLIYLQDDDKYDIEERHAINIRHSMTLGATGIDLSKWTYHKPCITPIRFIFTGRLLYDKGIREFMIAANQIKQHQPDIQFSIYGDFDEGNPFTMCQEDFDLYNHNKAVVFEGFCHDLSSALTQSSVFVLPSYREGLSLSVQEAMATGRPIITTDVPGCRQTIEHHKNGLLVAPFDSEGLKIAMQYFINNPEKIEEMGQHSYELSQKYFNISLQSKKIIQFILNN